MDDELSFVESEALEWLRSGKGLDDRNRAVQLLQGISEQRKLKAETEKSLAELESARYEQSFRRTRFWATTLVPLLAVALTAATFLAQIRESAWSRDKDEDTQWREALKKVDSEGAGATITALQMESFFNSPKYWGSARTIAAAVLPATDNQSVFDDVFASLMAKIREEYSRTGFEDAQDDLIGVARALTMRVRADYEAAQKLRNLLHSDSPALFSMFLRKPVAFFPENDPALARTLDDEWKLDTVSKGLGELWRERNGLSVKGRELEGIVFLNGDFSGVDFSKAAAEQASFYGDCKLNGARGITQSADRCGASQDVPIDAHMP